MSDERFQYNGPATIDGMSFESVRLHEVPTGNALRSWEGRSTFAGDEMPPGFPGNLQESDGVSVVLPDGRTGFVLVTNVSFDGSSWTVEMKGNGPSPR